MIPELQQAILQIKEETSKGYHSNVVDLISDMIDVGIPVTALSTEAKEVVMQLGQAQADHQAKYVTDLLGRGCYGTAGYIMNMYIHRIAEGLGNVNNMGYQQLDALIQAARVPSQMAWERAGDNEVWREAERIAHQQRTKALGCPGYG